MKNMKNVNTKKRITAVLMSFVLVFLLMIQIFIGVGTAYATPASKAWFDITGGFNSPAGVAVSSDGTVYVADADSDRIIKLPTGSSTWEDITGMGGFNYPCGVAVSSDGTVYVTDTNNQKIKKLPSGSSTWEDITGSGGFSFSVGVSVSSDGTVYVTDTYNHQIKKLLSGSSIWEDITGSGGFSYPRGVSVSSDGIVYVADTYNHQIKKLPSGGSTWEDITGLGGFNYPYGVSVSSDGIVYVADTVNHQIKKLLSGSNIWEDITGSGGFSYPRGVSVSSDGTVYVADTDHNKIKKLLSVYTVSFDSGEGSTVDAQTVIENGHAKLPSAPSKTDYTFGGWYTDTHLTVLFDFATNVITADQTLYAKWKPINYMVSFNVDGGSAIANVNADYNTTITAPTAPTKANYSFGGWYKESALTNTWDFATEKVIGNTTLFAKWAPINYAVSFEVDGGSTIANVNADYNTAITAPTAPTKANYSFGGWYKESALSNTWDFATEKVIGNTTLYAKWTPINYAVSFEVDGGSAIANVNADYNTAITAPTAPTKANYSFGGWYKESALSNTWDFATEKVIGNTTLYAKWTSSNNGDGGSKPPTVPTATPAPTVIPTPVPTPTLKPFYNEKVNIDVIKALVEKTIYATAVTFKDVPKDSPTAKAIELATKLGIVKGYADASFHANSTITRAEFATILVKVLGLKSEGDSSFKDTKGHWAADAIAILKSNGIIKGYMDGTFKPNQTISRAEIVAMLSKVINTTLVKSAKFNDVAGHWAEAEIDTLSDMGIVEGAMDGSFKPNASATRFESLLMVLRMLNISLGLSLDIE